MKGEAEGKNMPQQRTYSYRLEYTKQQRVLFNRYAGCARFVYNHALSLIKAALERGERPPSCVDIDKLLPKLKRSEEKAWLKEPHSQVLQQSLINLRHGLIAHYKDETGKVGFPHFKQKGKNDSFRFPQGVKLENEQVFLPKIGWVKMRYSRPIEGTIKQATVKRSADHWFVNIVCLVEKDVQKVPIREERAVGIDLGLLSLATLSNGTVIPNLKFFFSQLLRLKSRSLQLMDQPQ
jgi:putative transposase